MAHDPFYWSPRWREARAAQLRRCRWCVVCLQIGFRTRATEVDHLVARSAGGSAFAVGNLQSLCRVHHSQKTARGPERGAFKGSGPYEVIGPDGFPVPGGLLPPRDETEGEE